MKEKTAVSTLLSDLRLCVYCDRTHSVEQHAVPYARLDILWTCVTRVFPQEVPCSSLTVVSVQPAELRL